MIWRRGLDDGGCEWSSSSNRFQQAYVQGFVDVSGGNVLLRAGPTNNNHLILEGGDISLNGRLFVTKDASLNGNVCLYKKPFLSIALGAGTNNIATSTDGINWTGRTGTSIFSSAGRAAAWNGSIWVAVGSGTNTIATSTDGINWTGRGSSIFSTHGFGVAWYGSTFVALGEGTNAIATSTDGITWTGRSGMTIFGSGGRGAASNGSIWVAFGAIGAGTNSIATSTDSGATWTGRTGTTIFTNALGVAWNGSIWVGVGTGTHAIATSTDGINWTGRGTSVLSTGTSVAWNGSMWVAVGNGPYNFATSTDGITWTGRGTSIFSTSAYSIAWNGSLWIAVGNGTSNSIATSTDGITWTGQGTSTFSTYAIGVSAISSSSVSLALDNTRPNQLNIGGSLVIAGDASMNGNVYVKGSLSWAQSAFISCGSTNVGMLVNTTQTFNWTSDPNNLLGFSAVSANSTITIPYTGYYSITFGTYGSASGAVNSSCAFTATTTPETFEILRLGYPGVSGFTQALCGTKIIKFTAGNTIVITGINGTAGGITLGNTYLQVVRLI